MNTWKQITELDKTSYWYGLVTDGDVIRLQLWNPVGYWEHTNPIGKRVVPLDSGLSEPTYFMNLPDLPRTRTNRSHGPAQLNKMRGERDEDAKTIQRLKLEGAILQEMWRSTDEEKKELLSGLENVHSGNWTDRGESIEALIKKHTPLNSPASPTPDAKEKE